MGERCYGRLVRAGGGQRAVTDRGHTVSHRSKSVRPQTGLPRAATDGVRMRGVRTENVRLQKEPQTRSRGTVEIFTAVRVARNVSTRRERRRQSGGDKYEARTKIVSFPRPHPSTNNIRTRVGRNDTEHRPGGTQRCGGRERLTAKHGSLISSGGDPRPRVTYRVRYPGKPRA